MTYQKSTTSLKDKKNEDSEFLLSPIREALKIKGTLFYNEGAQAWNTIRLKKEVLYEFPALRDKRSKFNYTMIIPRSLEEIEKQLEDIKKSDNMVPIFLFFGKCKTEN